MYEFRERTDSWWATSWPREPAAQLFPSPSCKESLIYLSTIPACPSRLSFSNLLCSIFILTVIPFLSQSPILVFIIICDDNNVLASHSSVRSLKSGYPLKLRTKRKRLKKRHPFIPSFLPSFSGTHPCFRLQCRVESRSWLDSRGGFHVTGAKSSRVVLSSLPANSSLQHSHMFSQLKMTV